MLDNVKRHIVRLQKDPKAVQLRHAAHVGILLNGNTTGPGLLPPIFHTGIPFSVQLWMLVAARLDFFFFEV